ncbi:unnamed protein product [Brachionus calyciflorus]|uniref:Uncharacterized protein n=1 Tax=Brachionus calyciflorus TaxID=104777 RepID=A0A813UKT2_9BILA|nr:unnamed protein product [Brachionus calyciflorus]
MISVDSPLGDQLKFLYPFENPKEFQSRKEKCKKNNYQAFIKDKVLVVNDYLKLGFVPFDKLTADFQKIIRNNRAPFSSNFKTAIDFLQRLSEKLNDKDLNCIINPEFLELLYKDPLIIEKIKQEGLDKMKILKNKFTGYAPNSKIQIVLLVPEENLKEHIKLDAATIEKNANIIKKIDYLISLDFKELKFPQGFFSNDLLNYVITEHSKDHLFCFEGLDLLYEFYQILGDSHLNELNNVALQNFLLWRGKTNEKDANNTQKEIVFEEVKKNVPNLLKNVKESLGDLELIVSKTILISLITDNEFEYSKSLELVKKIKNNFPLVKLAPDHIWHILRPVLFINDRDVEKAKIQDQKIKHNLNILFQKIDDTQNKDDRNEIIKYVDIDFIDALIQVDIELKPENLDAAINLNKQQNKGLMLNSSSIKTCFRHNVTIVSNNVDELKKEISNEKDQKSFEIANAEDLQFSPSNFEGLETLDDGNMQSLSQSDIIIDMDMADKLESEVVEIQNESDGKNQTESDGKNQNESVLIESSPIENFSQTSPMSPSSPNSLSSPSQDASSRHSKKILEQLSKDMIKSTGDYIKEEIDICISDYKLLEQMNKLVTDKYKNLTKYTTGISSEMEKLNEAYATLTPLLSQIDEVEKCVGELEQSAAKLDAYSKRLDTKFKQFTEKILNK